MPGLVLMAHGDGFAALGHGIFRVPNMLATTLVRICDPDVWLVRCAVAYFGAMQADCDSALSHAQARERIGFMARQPSQRRKCPFGPGNGDGEKAARYFTAATVC